MRRLAALIAPLLLGVLVGPPTGPGRAAGSDQNPAGQQQLSTLRQDPSVSRALELARSTEAQTISDQIRFCETPAPPFQERNRAGLLQAAFKELGLQNVRVDRVGNVLGDRPGRMMRPRLLVSAHLDTVFPPGTDVKVKRNGALLTGPGIGDNCRGLAVLVAVARAMRTANVATSGSVTFVANVGEEGLGDLRGMKELFQAADRTRPSDIDAFLSLDGAGLSVTNVAVGSRRYKVTFTGTGGHSYASFGIPNPAGALGRAIAKIQELQVPQRPRTTFNIGRIGGGTSVNAIPFEAWMEVDLRSPDRTSLSTLDGTFQRAVDAAVQEENRRWGAPKGVTVSKELVGDRPAGEMSAESRIVTLAVAAARALGFTAPLGEGSSDANWPVSLGIPAITIGAGGGGNDVHAPTESFDSTDAWKGTQHALLLIVALTKE